MVYPKFLLLFACGIGWAGEAAWEKPRFKEREDERQWMVEAQIARRGVSQKKVLDAMLAVPRHLFVPKSEQKHAYGDTPLPIACGQTISQPYIVAYMTELLDVGPDDKALEIGTGSGYQAAVLSELTPHVYSVEIYKELAETAEKTFRRIGYKTIRTRAGDGYHGWREHAPFDAIIVTCAATHVPPPLVEQLAPGGRMVIPVGTRFAVQKLIIVEKDQEGKVSSRADLPVRFVPLLGSHDEPE